MPIIVTLLCVAVYTILFMGNPNMPLNNNLNSETKENVDNNEELKSDSTNSFNGALYYENSGNIDEIFTYNIPSNFQNQSISTSLHYTYGDESIFGDCVVDLNSISGYSSAEKLISEMSQYYNVNNSKQIINNIEWFNFIDDSFGKEFYYAMDINDEVYFYKFEINTDEVIDECTNYHNSIINSLSLK